MYDDDVIAGEPSDDDIRYIRDTFLPQQVKKIIYCIGESVLATLEPRHRTSDAAAKLLRSLVDHAINQWRDAVSKRGTPGAA